MTRQSRSVFAIGLSIALPRVEAFRRIACSERPVLTYGGFEPHRRLAFRFLPHSHI